MATANNDHTGDPMKSKLGDQAAYSTGYDIIFGNKSIPHAEEAPETQCQKSHNSTSHSSNE